MLRTLVVAVATLGLFGPSIASAADQPAAYQPTELVDGTWSGTATATCRCEDDRCRTISCSVSGAASYEDAKSRLRARIEAEARSNNGKIEGSISFSISKELVQLRAAADPDKETWQGTASATCRCDDDRCVTITCEVKGAASYHDAQSRLRAKIEAEARSRNGKVEGGISFSITKEFK